jgi:hypothetical protein
MRSSLLPKALIACTFLLFGSLLHGQSLLHYWNFNNTSSYADHIKPNTSILSGAALDTLRFPGGTSLIDHLNGTGQGFDVNNFNARNGDVAGNHLRFNNPIYGALIFSLPTSGYKDVVVKYASLRSGSGAYLQFIDYSTDGGANYTRFDTISPTTTATLYALDFTGIKTVENNSKFKLKITFGQGGGGTAGNNRLDNFTCEGNVLPSLVHYWNFNDNSTVAKLTVPSSLVTGAAITHITGGTSAIDAVGGTGQNFNVANVNARNGDVSGTHLRFNNPIGGGLLFNMPSTGYRKLMVKYATRRSGSGAGWQFVHYTTDGTNFTLFDTIRPLDADPQLVTLDFSSITATNNNKDFAIRFTFGQGPGGTVGNNRFDNFTLEAESISGGDVTPPGLAFLPKDGEINIATNTKPEITFTEDVRLIAGNLAINSQNIDTCILFKKGGASGSNVAFDATVNGRVVTITPSAALDPGATYYMAVRADVLEDFGDNALDTMLTASFTTLALQTNFKAGDIVPVAYRMNATGADDEVALLTLVNILPGTILRCTDAKYTDNAQAQCDGGLVWTAPSSGVAAGTVIVIRNDAGTASIGTVSGATFGLSSGGDQFIVYTGTAAAPNHVTALSSNAWLSANTSCIGSNSKIPASLQDGKTSINLSAANGNVSGNTVNAFYNGPQNLPYAQLRDSVLDVKYWNGTASGTAPQTWPGWNFPGPPSVRNAWVQNSQAIRVAFNRDMDAASATDSNNYKGISGIASIQRSNNGAAADTITIQYNTAFASGSSYQLDINGVKDADGLAMFGTYNFNFTYNTVLAFEKNFVVVEENAGSISFKLTLSNPATSSVKLVLKPAPWSTAGAQDITFSTQNLQFTGASLPEQTISIPVVDDALPELDEYFVLALEDANDLNVSGTDFATIFIRDNDKNAPAANKEIELIYKSSFDPNVTAGSTTEIVAYDSVSRRLFLTSAIQDRLDIADFSNPSAIRIIRSVDMSTYGGITSVAVFKGLVAVASPNANEQLNGSVVFFDTAGTFLKQVTVGALPDMVCFTPDGSKVLTANEGQPNNDYSVDPEGSVSLIDLSKGISALSQSDVTTMGFQAFNAQEAALLSGGVRKLNKASTLAQDFEPEFVAVSADSKKAWVTLQENNAIGEIDIDNKQIVRVWSQGTKDWMAAGNGFDASDNNQQILLSSWPVQSFFISDAAGVYRKDGVNYLITANEGDEKEYATLNERTTVGASTYRLDSAGFPHAAMLKLSHNLGRLRVTNLHGDTDNDGDFDVIHSVGTRSFSIFNADTRTLVYDSKDDFERITSRDPKWSAIFNCDNEGNALKSRSRAKGPEPEGLTLGTINGRTYAFVGLERIGGVMAYNITDPQNPRFVDYNNSRSTTAFSGDHGPEGIVFINERQSPDGKPYILVANEISGTVAIYELKVNTPNSVRILQGESRTLKLYPNPAHGGEVQLEKQSDIEVFDALGRSLHNFKSVTSFAVGSWMPGLYIVKAADGSSARLIVE